MDDSKGLKMDKRGILTWGRHSGFCWSASEWLDEYSVSCGGLFTVQAHRMSV